MSDGVVAASAKVTMVVRGDKPRVPRVLKFGSDFSGLDSAWLALKRLKIPAKLVFCSDNNAACKQLLLKLHEPERFYNDVSGRSPSELEYCDLYVTTPPCQAWSSAGQRRGLQDSEGRGIVLQESVRYVQAMKPRVVCLENVKGMMSKKFLPVFKGVKKAMRSLGYNVYSTVLNSADFKVAQDRKRVFIVAIRTDSQRAGFRWPKPEGRAKLADVLDPVKATDKPCRLPRAPRASSLARKACQEVFRAGVDPREVPVAVDVDASPRFASYGVNICKTMTKSRAATGGFWVSTRGRKMTLQEIMRVSGLQDDELGWKSAGVTEKQVGGMLGNSVPVPLMAAVLRQAMIAGGLTSTPSVIKRMIKPKATAQAKVTAKPRSGTKAKTLPRSLAGSS